MMTYIVNKPVHIEYKNLSIPNQTANLLRKLTQLYSTHIYYTLTTEPRLNQLIQLEMISFLSLRDSQDPNDLLPTYSTIYDSSQITYVYYYITFFILRCQ